MNPLDAIVPSGDTWAADGLVEIPDVDCGEGYRQLEWLEEIRETDEYFADKAGWLQVANSGARYRPFTANSIYAPCAIIRRSEKSW